MKHLIDIKDLTIEEIQTLIDVAKDIIKINEKLDINLDILGYLDSNITINKIVNGKIVKKYHPELPKKLVNIIKCKNPRCITSVEQELPQIFELTDKENRVYRCKYCEEKIDL